MKKSLLFSISFCIALVFLSSYLIFQMYNDTKAVSSAVKPMQVHKPSQAVLTSKTIKETATLGAIGDILIHDRVYNVAKTKNGYNFNPMFKEITPLLQQPDLLLANQETILGGPAFRLSGYPQFNSPQEVGDAVLAAGVDIVSTANNHSLDRGEKGLTASLQYLNKIGLPYTGTYQHAKDKEKVRVLDANGIKVAYLAYTYGTNGIPVPKEKDYLVNLIDRKAMKADIQQAKKEADVIVVNMHWGNEYQRFPADVQTDLARFLANEGVDIVFGQHPHVLQPMEWVTGKNGHKTFVVYSLGNFLSGQQADYKDIGGMATIEVTKTIDGDGTKISLANPKFYPTYVSNHWKTKYHVVPLEKADKYGLPNAKAKTKEIQKHMTGNLKN